jgi:hypothetical protein
MRRILLLALALAAVWGGYWWSGATAMERGLRGWLDARAAEGWTASYDAVETRGFPSRFDTSFRGLALSPPGAAWEWRAPEFQTLMLSYAPNRAVAAWPGPQTVATPAGDVVLEGERMRASVRLGVAASLPLQEFRAVAEALRVRGDPGWTLTAEEASLAVAVTPAAPNGQRLGVRLTGLRAPPAVRARIDPEGAMPEALDGLHLDADLGFDAPWDRHALEDTPPRLTEIGLRDASFSWGALALVASGDVEIGPDGVPEGRIDVRVEEWRLLLDLMRALGLLGERALPLAEGAMGVLAGLSPQEDVVEAPLSFQNGFVSLGPIPLGPAPRLAPPS